MDSFELVRPAYLNNYGFLFGGQMLKWVDERAWIAASVEFPGQRFVTIGIERAEFRHPVHDGSILRFHTECIRCGRTSLTYKIEVFATPPLAAAEEMVFSTNVTMVCVDADGNKKALPPKN